MLCKDLPAARGEFAQSVCQLFPAKVTAEERSVSFGPEKNGDLNYLSH